MRENFVVIPARAGSKGIPRKNSRKVKGKSLTIRSIIHAKLLVPNNNIILSTDSKKIINEVAAFFNISSYELKMNSLTKFGMFFIHYRSSSLSSDSALIMDVIFQIRELLKNLGRDINVICLLQPTTPFRSTQELIFIKNEMQKFSNSSYSLVSVCNVDNIHPAKMYFIDLKGKLKEIGGFSKFRFYRRQDLPDVFIRDGGFYIIGDLLIKKKMQYSTNPNCLVRKFPWSINIDNVSDLQLSQKIKSTEVSDDPNG